MPCSRARLPLPAGGAECAANASGCELRCQFWDVEHARWSGEGCTSAVVPAAAGGGEVLQCTCDHLTEFAGLSFPTSGGELLDELGGTTFDTLATSGLWSAIRSCPDIDANPEIFAVVVALACLSALTLPLCLWRGHRRRAGGGARPRTRRAGAWRPHLIARRCKRGAGFLETASSGPGPTSLRLRSTSAERVDPS